MGAGVSASQEKNLNFFLTAVAAMRRGKPNIKKLFESRHRAAIGIFSALQGAFLFHFVLLPKRSAFLYAGFTRLQKRRAPAGAVSKAAEQAVKKLAGFGGCFFRRRAPG